MPLTELFSRLGTPEAGLSDAEAAARLSRRGTSAPHHRRTDMVLLLRQFATPITLILIAATLLSALLGEIVDAAIILAIVGLSGMLSFWQEFSASNAMQELLKSVEVRVEVRRDNVVKVVAAHEVVAGDVVLLDTGDLVPGDCRIIRVQDVLVDEAPLTGESYPVEKAPDVLPIETAMSALSNCLLMGTHLVRGSAEAVVVHTGSATEFGKATERLAEQVAPTAFERGISAFGALLLRVMLILIVFVFVFNIALGRPLVDSFLFSLALAVGLTPQMLPAIVSISLSLGARHMARVKVIVKRLSAIEDFGAIDVLCTDKTGTLTAGAVSLAAAVAIDGSESSRVLDLASLNAFHHGGFSNPIDDAILARQRPTGISERLAEAPYDFTRKRLSVLVRVDGSTMLVTKGAVENVLAACANAEGAGGASAPLKDVEGEIRCRFEDLSRQGFRVLGVAVKGVAAENQIKPADEAGMSFAGFLCFDDPPKPDVSTTLQQLRGLGISMRMVTGDNRFAAEHVARAVGLQNLRLLCGSDLDQLDDDQLTSSVESVDVFAEVDPLQKERIVRALRRHGHTVGFLGDGINDAPALHAADVGISVDNAADVAKDSASIVLLAKDLNVLMQGVRLGRRTFANTLKYVFVTTSANFGNMASMAAAAAFLPFLPLLPLQVLLLNFLSDLPATTIAGDDVDAEQVEKPEAWNIHSIRNFMLVFGLISSGFDLMTFGILRIAFDAGPELFRSAWFLESLGTELAVMLILRTRRRFFASRPSALLFGTSLLTGLISLVIVLTAAGDPMGFTRVPTSVLASIAGILAAYIVVTEGGKAWFYSKHGPGRPRGDAGRLV